MKFKKYYIFFGIASIAWFATVGIPQVTGNAFISDYKTLKPADELSAIIMRDYKKPEPINHTIPANINTIKIEGNNIRSINQYININQALEKQCVEYLNKNDLNLQTSNDTLIINIKNGFTQSLILNINKQVSTIVADGLINQNIVLNQHDKINIIVQNKSDFILLGGQNNQVNNIHVNNQSSIGLLNQFANTIDLEVNNSMVYLDYLNHIDSLKVKLIGKSNIKKKELIVWREDAKRTFQHLKDTLNIADTHINIFPSGNLDFYYK